MDQPKRLPVLILQLVGGMQSSAGLHRDPDPDRHRDSAARRGRVHDHVQRLTFHPLHHDVEDLVLFPQIENFDHVRMPDARGQRGLVEEHLLEFGIVAHAGQHGLHRHELLESAVAFETRRPDHGHAAARERNQELVAAQGAVRQKVDGGSFDELSVHEHVRSDNRCAYPIACNAHLARRISLHQPRPARRPPLSDFSGSRERAKPAPHPRIILEKLRLGTLGKSASPTAAY